MLVFLFSAWACLAVGRSAQAVVKEVVPCLRKSILLSHPHIPLRLWLCLAFCQTRSCCGQYAQAVVDEVTSPWARSICLNKHPVHPLLARQ